MPLGGGVFWCPRCTFGDDSLDLTGMLRRAFATPCIPKGAPGGYVRAREVEA